MIDAESVACRPQTFEALAFALKCLKGTPGRPAPSFFDARILRKHLGTTDRTPMRDIFRHPALWSCTGEPGIVRKYRGQDRGRHDHLYYLDIDLEHSELVE